MSPQPLRLGAVVAALGAIGCSPLDDVQRGESALHGGSIHERFLAMSERDREACNIKQATWLTTNVNRPAHARLVVCFSKHCGNAEYDALGNVTNIPALTRMPTSGVVRIPDNVSDDKAAIAFIPGSSSDQSNAAGVFFTAAGVASVVMKHPDVGEIYGGRFAWPLSQFVDTHEARDYREGYLGLAREVRECVLGRLFGVRPRAYIATGISGGVLTGAGLLVRSDELEADDDFPFDGVVQTIGGNGVAGLLEQRQRLHRGWADEALCYTPLFQVPNKECLAKTLPTDGVLAHIVSLVDPKAGLALTTLGGAVDYRIEDQPAHVRRDWRHMEPGAALKVKTIILAGMLDTNVEVETTIAFAQRVVAAGAADLKRVYFFKTLEHIPTSDLTFAPGLSALIAWVIDGVEPPAIAYTGGRSSATCEARGFTNDPLACAWNEFNSP